MLQITKRPTRPATKTPQSETLPQDTPPPQDTQPVVDKTDDFVHAGPTMPLHSAVG